MQSHLKATLATTTPKLLKELAKRIVPYTLKNWNSLNMYPQLPTTISSSNDIARIGKLIENKEKNDYDYRYFI